MPSCTSSSKFPSRKVWGPLGRWLNLHRPLVSNLGPCNSSSFLAFRCCSCVAPLVLFSEHNLQSAPRKTYSYCSKLWSDCGGSHIRSRGTLQTQRYFSTINNNANDGQCERLPPPPREDIDFDSLPWNLNLPEEHCYLYLTTTPKEGWTSKHYDPGTDGGTLTAASLSPSEISNDIKDPKINPSPPLQSLKHYSTTPLPLYPATTSLNYGTTIWEGLACRRSPTSGKALVFRPQKNYQRFANGAHAMGLPPPSYELFMRGVQLVVQHNIGLLPPSPKMSTDENENSKIEGGAKLYIRPMLLGSGQQLGLHASPQISLLYYVSPTGSYFKGKTMGGLKLHLERRRSRAARGGTGSVKCCGNYAVTLRPLLDAKELGFDDNLYLELDTYYNSQPSTSEKSSSLCNAIIQELSAANIFLVLKTGEIVTPSLDRGTILPGVTRDSVLELAHEFKDELRPFMIESIATSGGEGDHKTNSKLDDIEIMVSERDVRVQDLLNASEVFITGTAAEIVPVYSIATSPTPKEESYTSGVEEESFSVTFAHGKSLPGGPVTTKLLDMLREVMAEQRQSKVTKDWLCDVFSSAEDFRRGRV